MKACRYCYTVKEVIGFIILAGLAGFIMLSLISCSGLEPTRTQTYGFDAVLAGLDWRTVAPGCVVSLPIPSVEGKAATYVQRTDDGRLMVTYRLDADHTLTVEFHAIDGVWRICGWDTSNY